MAVLVLGLRELPNHDLGEISRGWCLILVTVLLAFIVPLVGGYFSWRYTRFVIDDEQVRIERQFIWHRSERIAFTKVQSVDIVQPMVARLFGLAALRIDVGGQDGARSIEFLSRERASQLRDHLLLRAHASRTCVRESPQPSTGVESQDLPAADRVIVAIPPGRLLASLLVNDRTVITLVVTAVLITLLVLTGNLTVTGMTVFIVPWLVGIGSMLLARLRNEFRFTLTSTSNGGLCISSGLTSLVSQTIPPDRVQALDITRPLLWRPFGWHRMRINVLGSGLEAGRRSGASATVLLPAGPPDEVQAVLSALWPQLDIASIPRRAIPNRARWLRWLDANTYLWGHDEDVLVASGRLLNQRTSIVPHARVQSVRLRQGPLQRILRLASVQAHTTPGPVGVVCPHLDEKDARLLALAELDRMRQARDDTRRQPALPIHHDDAATP